MIANSNRSPHVSDGHDPIGRRACEDKVEMGRAFAGRQYGKGRPAA